MSASIPSTVPVFITLNDGPQGDDILAANENTPNAEISALATLVGMFGTGKTQAYGTDIVGWMVNNDPFLTKTSASALSISAGTAWICNSGQSVRLPRQNSVATAINAANIDTGAMVIGFYYIYLCADAVANTFTVVFSTSSSAPTGYTNYELWGWFYNEANGSFDVTSGFFGHVKSSKHGRLPNYVLFSSETQVSTASTTFVNDTQAVGQFYSNGGPVLMIYDTGLAFSGTNAAHIGLSIDAADVTATERETGAGDGTSSSSSKVGLMTTYVAYMAKGSHSVTGRFFTSAGTAYINKRNLAILEL